MPAQQWEYDAGVNEEAGRGIEPRNASSVDSRRTLTAVRRGKPTVCTHRKAAVLGAFWRVCGTPPGSENGACIPRGHAGTWESHLSPGSYSRMRGAGDQRPWRGLGASTRPRARQGHHERTEAGEVSGSERRAQRPEMGRVAVCAEQRTDEGGEPRPTGPPRGQAPPGLTWRRQDRRERPCDPPPSHQNSTACRHRPPAIRIGSLRRWAPDRWRLATGSIPPPAPGQCPGA